ncbi:MAG: cofactor-independent phosphoglycerate mutase [Dehalococcoidales bacterium]
MKYVVLILDGAAGLPIPAQENRTCLEISRTPNLDQLAQKGQLGTAKTVPQDMEPSSAVACMSVMGYDPLKYYKGRAAIEATSLDIPVGEDEVVFRCNLVNTEGGIMRSYCAGHITTEEAGELVSALNNTLGNQSVTFYPGVGYRHILKLRDHNETLNAITVPPHDISNLPVSQYLPSGEGSEILLKIIHDSRQVLGNHPVNAKRRSANKITADSIWLTWGSGKPPRLPSFEEAYGKHAAITSGVDLLRGLGKMMSIETLDIPGITDGQDNDCVAQAEGAIEALARNDLVIVHFEAPDEAGHAGSIEQKVAAIEKADRDMVGRLAGYLEGRGRLLVMPDHPTPIELLTHTSEPVPFLIWGRDISAGKGSRFTEIQARQSGITFDPGWHLMQRLIAG